MKVYVVINHYEFDAVFSNREAAVKYMEEMHKKDSDLNPDFLLFEEELRGSELTENLSGDETDKET